MFSDQQATQQLEEEQGDIPAHHHLSSSPSSLSVHFNQFPLPAAASSSCSQCRMLGEENTSAAGRRSAPSSAASSLLDRYGEVPIYVCATVPFLPKEEEKREDERKGRSEKHPEQLSFAAKALFLLGGPEAVTEKVVLGRPSPLAYRKLERRKREGPTAGIPPEHRTELAAAVDATTITSNNDEGKGKKKTVRFQEDEDQTKNHSALDENVSNSNNNNNGGDYVRGHHKFGDRNVPSEAKERGENINYGPSPKERKEKEEEEIAEQVMPWRMDPYPLPLQRLNSLQQFLGEQHSLSTSPAVTGGTNRSSSLGLLPSPSSSYQSESALWDLLRKEDRMYLHTQSPVLHGAVEFRNDILLQIKRRRRRGTNKRSRSEEEPRNEEAEEKRERILPNTANATSAGSNNRARQEGKESSSRSPAYDVQWSVLGLIIREVGFDREADFAYQPHQSVRSLGSSFPSQVRTLRDNLSMQGDRIWNNNQNDSNLGTTTVPSPTATSTSIEELHTNRSKEMLSEDTKGRSVTTTLSTSADTGTAGPNKSPLNVYCDALGSRTSQVFPPANFTSAHRPATVDYRYSDSNFFFTSALPVVAQTASNPCPKKPADWVLKSPQWLEIPEIDRRLAEALVTIRPIWRKFYIHSALVRTGISPTRAKDCIDTLTYVAKRSPFLFCRCKFGQEVFSTDPCCGWYQVISFWLPSDVWKIVRTIYSCRSFFSDHTLNQLRQELKSQEIAASFNAPLREFTRVFGKQKTDSAGLSPVTFVLDRETGRTFASGRWEEEKENQDMMHQSTGRFTILGTAYRNTHFTKTDMFFDIVFPRHRHAARERFNVSFQPIDFSDEEFYRVLLGGWQHPQGLHHCTNMTDSIIQGDKDTTNGSKQNLSPYPVQQEDKNNNNTGSTKATATTTAWGWFSSTSTRRAAQYFCAELQQWLVKKVIPLLDAEAHRVVLETSSMQGAQQHSTGDNNYVPMVDEERRSTVEAQHEVLYRSLEVLGKLDTASSSSSAPLAGILKTEERKRKEAQSSSAGSAAVPSSIPSLELVMAGPGPGRGGNITTYSSGNDYRVGEEEGNDDGEFNLSSDSSANYFEAAADEADEQVNDGDEEEGIYERELIEEDDVDGDFF